MKRLCVFAHFDSQNIIDAYVLYYIEHLTKVFSRVVFVSDNELSDAEIKKLAKLIDQNDVVAIRHGEYDFGSYKRGLKVVDKDLSQYEQLILCNDSCYGPFYSLYTIFDEMESPNIDFWGLTLNDENGKHLVHAQSFFLVFNKNVFSSEIFKKFWDSVGKLNTKKDIVANYEVGLSRLLVDYGFIMSSYIKNYHIDVTITKYEEIIKQGFPLLKRQLVKRNFYGTDIYSWKKVVNENTNYPVELIASNLRRSRVTADYWHLFLQSVRVKGVFHIVTLREFLRLIFRF